MENRSLQETPVATGRIKGLALRGLITVAVLIGWPWLILQTRGAPKAEAPAARQDTEPRFQTRKIALDYDFTDWNPQVDDFNHVDKVTSRLLAGRSWKTYPEFKKAFAEFSPSIVTEGRLPRCCPPLDFEHCVHYNVLIFRKIGHVPTPLAGSDGDISAGHQSWYLTVAFDKTNGLCQWWYIWESD